ncbi:chitin deacetylase [Irineochytrium annulatum]|nr:chitin deacetylase [Irineochytrium annulatum]
MLATRSMRLTVTLAILATLSATQVKKDSNTAIDSVTAWPDEDKQPPIIPEWSAKYLSADASTKYPDLNLPVSSYPQAHPDWSQDMTNCTGPLSWGLSYDDGPSKATIALLDFLDEVNVKATFFVVGSRLLDNSGQNNATLLRAYKAGHQIAIHTWSHSPISTQSNEQIVAEVMWTSQIIQGVIGVTPTYFRPPYGDIDRRSRAVLHSMGLKVVNWNADSTDWLLQYYPAETQATPNSVKKMFEYIIANPPQDGESGVIMLEHDLFPYSAAEAPIALKLILNAGYNVMPVSECGSAGGFLPYKDPATGQLLGLGPTVPTTTAPWVGATATGDVLATTTVVVQSQILINGAEGASPPSTMLAQLKERGNRLFYHHGIYCASHPWLLMICSGSLMVALSYPAVLGLFMKNVTSPAAGGGHSGGPTYGPTQFWESPSARAPRQEELFIERFGSAPFLRLEQVVINASDTDAAYIGGRGPGVIDRDMLAHALDLQRRIEAVELDSDPDSGDAIPMMGDGVGPGGTSSARGVLTLRDICYKPFEDGRCLIHTPLEFWGCSGKRLAADADPVATLSNASALSSFGTPIPLHSVFGGVAGVGSGSLAADSIVITYFLEERRGAAGGGDDFGGGPGAGWTSEVWDRIWSAALEAGQRAETSGVEVGWRSKGEVKHLYYVFDGGGDEDRWMSAEMMILFVSYGIVFLYISLVLGRVELVKSKFGLGLAAVVMVFGSLLMSVGLSSMMGVKTSLVPTEVLPFLIIAVGVENIFVLTNAVVTTSLDLPVKERVGLGKSSLLVVQI